MFTVRHLEKLWSAKLFSRLLGELLAGRPEASLRLESELAQPTAAAAMGLLRLDELNQGHTKLYTTLLRTVLASQDQDGGWGDPMTTALCLRALLAGRGQGIAIDRALFYLAEMQKSEGIWPKVPFRRMPADPFVSAFILLQLGSEQRFRQAVRFLDAINWFEANERSLDPQTRRLWDHASMRCQIHRLAPSEPVLSWS